MAKIDTLVLTTAEKLYPLGPHYKGVPPGFVINPVNEMSNVHDPWESQYTIRSSFLHLWSSEGVMDA